LSLRLSTLPERIFMHNTFCLQEFSASKEAAVSDLLRKTKIVKVKTTLARTCEFTLPQDILGWEVV
jgi:hypothetical protein